MLVKFRQSVMSLGVSPTPEHAPVTNFSWPSNVSLVFWVPDKRFDTEVPKTKVGAGLVLFQNIIRVSR